ncbi:F23F12.8 [Symbiodinium sp. CCMP2456]|nr:F23F12.8 [Symbiodinium sp. CCMP2456]
MVRCSTKRLCRLVIAECEAEARADASSGSCSVAQALAVRLALRFESRPKDILVSMSEAGLPAAKDQRSTVKTIMRLCHPDKCKHPEAKRAMQILGPLLS